jgi:hypothetical protein
MTERIAVETLNLIEISDLFQESIHIAMPKAKGAIENEMKKSKVLFLNVLRREPHISHFTLERPIELVNELKPEKFYFNQISH